MQAISPALSVVERGIVDYPEALALQHELAGRRARGEIADTLLLLEHPHVVTRGVGASRYSLGGTPHPVFDIERGGDVTYHGPGQLVGYPILHLQERKLLVGRYLRLLEDAIIDALGGFGLEAERRKGFTGVWARGKKIASIGIAVRSWVAFHGFALNVSTDLSQFNGLYPCGLEPERMSTMAALLDREVPMADVRRAVRNSFVAKLSF